MTTTGSESGSMMGTGWMTPAPGDIAQTLARVAAEVGSRYQVKGYLGRGAFATVWEARDQVADQVVALKRFETKSCGRGFYRELSTLFRLEHDRIVRIVNLLETPDGARYLILEFCPGGNLRQALSRAKRAGEACPAGRVGEFAGQVATGLAAAHKTGLVHRDIKPENILFDSVSDGYYGGRSGVKLADFGLARALQRSEGGELHALSGSPAYMAPEQFLSTYGPPSDLYSLGVILYELFHGQLPFEGTPEKLARQHLRDAPALSPDLPAVWAQLLSRLLDKDPARRPTAEELRSLCAATDNRRSDSDLRKTRGPARPERATPKPADIERVAARLDRRTASFVLPLPTGASSLVFDGMNLVALTPAGLLIHDPAEPETAEIHTVTGLSESYRDEQGGVWVLRDRAVCALEGTTLRETHALPEAVAAMAVGAGGRLAAIMGDELREYAPEGGPVVWSRPVRVHGLTPVLARLCVRGRDYVVVSEGPVGSRLLVADAAGEKVASIRLPGLCWELGVWGRTQDLYARLFVRGELAGYRVRLSTREAEPLEQGEDLCCLAAGPDETLYGLKQDGLLVCWSPDGAARTLFRMGPAQATYRHLATDGARVAAVVRHGGDLSVHGRTLEGRGR